MKKKLLYLTSILLFSAASINAQTTWDFSTAATTIGTVSTNNSATINLDPTVDAAAVKFGPTYNTGAPATIVTTGFPGLEFGYKNSTSTKYTFYFLNEGYFQANGKDVILTITGCTAGENIAVKYSAKSTTPVIAQEFAVPSTVSASIVTAFPTNCTVNTATTTALSSTGTEDIQVVNLTVTADGNVNLLAGSPGFRILKIVRGGTIVLGVNDSFQQESSIVVYANAGKINLSNVTSATTVNVYNVLGSLVRSIKTSQDSSLDINAGVYIVKAQSAEGVKTVKVIVQ